MTAFFGAGATLVPIILEDHVHATLYSHVYSPFLISPFGMFLSDKCGACTGAINSTICRPIMASALCVCIANRLATERLRLGDKTKSTPEDAAGTAGPEAHPAGDPETRTASSSVSSTTVNPMMARHESGEKLRASAKGGSGKRNPTSAANAKLSKRALEIYAATNPATQGGDSEQPTAQL